MAAFSGGSNRKRQGFGSWWRLSGVAAGLICLLALATTPLVAQTGQGSVTGSVTDATGAAIPGASVTVTNMQQGVHYSAVTNGAGAYTVPALIPGVYQIKVEARGFKSEISRNITLEVSQIARQNFKLEPGGVTSTVEVSGAPVPLDTDDSTVGQVIPSHAIVGLPLNGRNYLQLSLLTVGVTPATGGRNQATGGFSALCQHSSQMRVILDGVDNTSRMSGGELGFQSQIVTPSVDAVQAFKVVTNNAPAEDGYRMGGTVIVSTKSGTNQFHGTAYEFLRNNKLDAANYFSGGQPEPPYHRNEFGGVLGGPIVRNKTFFFVSYDATRLSQSQSSISTVPTPAELEGDFSGQPTIYDPATTKNKKTRKPFLDNKIPSSRFDPVALKLATLFPAPNLPGTVNNFYFQSPSNETPNEVDARLDQTFSQRFRGFVRFSHRWDDATTGGALPLPADGVGWTTLHMTANSAVADLNTAISPNTFNDFVLGYSNLATILGTPATENENAKYGLTGLPDFGKYNQQGLAVITFSGFTSLGSKNSNPNTNNMNLVQASDKLLLSRGHHTITAGFSFLAGQVKRLSSKQSRGQLAFTGDYTEDIENRAATGSSIADFLLGDVQTISVSNLVGETVTDLNYSAYAEDNWHILPPLSLNVGVRWDMFGRPYYGHTPVDVFHFTPGTQDYQVIYPSGLRDCGCDNDWKNFAPRVGFAYQLRPRTVIRSGFGIIFGQPDGAQDTAGGYFNQSPSFDKVAVKGNKTTEPAGSLQDGFPAVDYNSGVIPKNVSAQTALRYMPNQYAMQWFGDVEQQIGNNTVFTLSYLGSGTRHLVVEFDLDQPPPGPGSISSRSPYPYFSQIVLNTPVGSAQYNALTAKINRQFANGFMLLGSYTWSHSIDDDVENLNSLNGEGIQNNFDLAAERGDSVFDMRNYFVASAIYDLPFGQGRRFLNRGGFLNEALGGWQLSGIVSLHSGPPFTPYLSTDIANTGTSNRPNRIGSGSLSSGERSIQNWFNVADFPVQAPYTFGDSGRNILRAPGTKNVDLKIGKVFRLTERFDLQFRSEFFNALNTPAFGAPDGEVDLPQGPTITTAGTAREIQFGAKLRF